MEQQKYEPFPNGIPPSLSTPLLGEAEARDSAPAACHQHRPRAAEPAPADPAPPSPAYRRDGWTAQARATFLEVLAETGLITRTCAAVGLSRQSAHALGARDRVFAASVDAACLLARQPLAG